MCVHPQASLFHVRPLDMITRNPEFAWLIFPNLLKELVGWKTE